MNNRDYQIVKKIIDEMDIAMEMVANIMLEEFLLDEKLKRAISMTLINIGELVKNLTDEFRTENKHIPWREITGFRDMAAHKYLSLNMQDVYATATGDLKQLSKQIGDIFSAARL